MSTYINDKYLNRLHENQNNKTVSVSYIKYLGTHVYMYIISYYSRRNGMYSSIFCFV